MAEPIFTMGAVTGIIDLTIGTGHMSAIAGIIIVLTVIGLVTITDLTDGSADITGDVTVVITDVIGNHLKAY